MRLRTRLPPPGAEGQGLLGHSEALVNHSAPSVSYGYFSAFSGQNDTGTSMPMWHCTRCRIPWTANGSWTNNQTTGAIANFLDDSGVSNDEIVREGAARMLAAALEVEVNAIQPSSSPPSIGGGP
ncbi:hypothetical protein [Streptomyces sp. NPDC002491]